MENWIRKWEEQWNIEILFACEAGSRAWGTDSDQSDTDLRFIFKQREVRSYLSLKKPPEVIDFNEPIDGHGWDIFKAFQLAGKSNPSIFEWAFSPIIYVDKDQFSSKLREVVSENFSLYTLAMHYLSLMTRNLKELSRKEQWGLKEQKQFIQVLRARMIIIQLMEQRTIGSGPFFEVDRDSNDFYKKSYRKLVLAKKEGLLLSDVLLKELFETLFIEKDRLKETCLELPKGENFVQKLDKWLWELLHV